MWMRWREKTFASTSASSSSRAASLRSPLHRNISKWTLLCLPLVNQEKQESPRLPHSSLSLLPTPSPPIATEKSCPSSGVCAVGRRSKLTPQEDPVIVREVAVAQAHIGPVGQTRERFEIASIAIATKKMSTAVTWKSIQDRYKRLQARFDRNDRVDAAMSGLGGEVGELDELLSSMREARQDMCRARDMKRQKMMYLDAEKERLGVQVRKMATERRVANGSESLLDSDGEPSEPSVAANKSPHCTDPFAGDVVMFADMLTGGDAARNELEKERMKLERERLEMERAERAEVKEKWEREIEDRRKSDRRTTKWSCKSSV